MPNCQNRHYGTHFEEDDVPSKNLPFFPFLTSQEANFLILKHFPYMLVPILVCYSETVDVHSLNFGYVFCYTFSQKMACFGNQIVISVNELIF